MAETAVTEDEQDADKNMKCMLRQCDLCRDKVIVQSVAVGEENDDVSYCRWEQKTETRMIKGKTKNITFMHMALISSRKHNLSMQLMQLDEPFMEHIFV